MLILDNNVNILIVDESIPSKSPTIEDEISLL